VNTNPADAVISAGHPLLASNIRMIIGPPNSILCQRRTSGTAAFVFAVVLLVLIDSDIAFAQQTFRWTTKAADDVGLDSSRLNQFAEQQRSVRTKQLIVVKDGHIVLELQKNAPHYTASLAKSIVGGLSLLMAMDDGLMNPDDPAWKFIPSWQQDPLRSKITIRHLATHSSGIEDAKQGDIAHNKLPGWKGRFWQPKSPFPPSLNPIAISINEAPVLFDPGTKFAYSNPGMGALAYAVTASLRDSPHTDLRTLLIARIYKPLGIDARQLRIGYGRTYDTDGLPVVANWGGGTANADVVARLGQLILNKGRWGDRQLVKAETIQRLLTVDKSTPVPARSDGPVPIPVLGWYSNADGVWKNAPRDTIVGAGAGLQCLIVIPSRKLVAVRFGDMPSQKLSFWAAFEQQLLNPLMAACVETPPADKAPYPRSSSIRELKWAPLESVLKRAEGSDNWPMTWGDDDRLYTAYGDGWGFNPKTKQKLSLGLVTIAGSATDFVGRNLRSPSAEQTGQGRKGLKASGILMVDGVLYMWVRNAGNSRLMWSKDRGSSWESAAWKLTISFAAPTFLNFGRNYDGAPDDFVYIYSFDSDSAYKPADRMVMARVPKEQLGQQDSYRFFAGVDKQGTPQWKSDILDRKAVFSHKGKCYRSGISYNAGLKRYFWVQILPGDHSNRDNDPRFNGGFGIYDAPQPWGPWTTTFFTEKWDMGPGESARFPTKWMTKDGKTMHLVSSTDDCFTVRKASVTVVE
jgi:CubicO group peptidase (beta-lactamase class C family)